MSDMNALVSQLTQAANGFQQSSSETDRLAGLQAAKKLVTAFQKPQDAVFHLAYSPTHILSVRVAIDLDIFNTLTERNRPVPLEEIAAVKGASVILTERILRLLVGIGYAAEHDVRVYTATPMTRQMTDRLSISVIVCLFDFTMATGTIAKTPEFIRQTGFQNPEGETTGLLQYAENTNDGLFEYMAKRPELQDSFNTFMEATRGSRSSWLEWCPVQEIVIDGFKGCKDDVLFVDMAGGRGHDIARLAAKFPDAPGRLVHEDLPHVIEDAIQDERVERLPFDLFKPQPVRGARAYYMKSVLHDWSDDDSLKILGHVRDAMERGYSKLLIEDFILPDKDCALLPAMWDLEMMLYCNSMERSRDHWTKLLDAAGLKVVKFWYPPHDGHGVVEAELK